VVRNPSGRLGTTGWVAAGRSTADGYAGRTSLVAPATGPGRATLRESRRHQLSAGQVVYARVAAKLDSGAGDMTLGVRFFGSYGARTAFRPLERQAAEPRRWQVLEGFDQAPPGTASYALEIRFEGDAIGRARIAAAQAFADPRRVPPVTLPGYDPPSRGRRVLPVFGGQEYTLTVDARVRAAGRAQLRFRDSRGGPLGATGTAIAPGGRRRVQVVAPAPRTAASARIVVTGRGLRVDGARLRAGTHGDWPTRPFLVGYNDNSGIGHELFAPAEWAAASVAAEANHVRFGAGTATEAQPTRSSPVEWSGTRAAAYLGALRAAGLKATVIVGNEPEWMDAGSAADDGQLAAIWADLVRRYPDVIAAVEWKNEPNLGAVGGAPPDPERYAAQLEAFRPLLAAAAPRTRLLVGGLADPPRDSEFGLTARTFLERAYAAGLAKSTDGVALHPYGPFGAAATGYGDRYVRGFYPTLRGAREAMDAGGDRGEAIWVTEFGQSTDPGGQVPPATERQQAQFNRMISTLLRRMPGVASAVVNTLRMPAGHAFSGFAVVDPADGRAKPAWTALRDEWRREPLPGPTPVCGPALARALAQRLQPRTGAGIGRTLCLDFTGDGRRDVVLSLTLPAGVHWAAYRASDRGYRRVLLRRGRRGLRLRHDGRAIVVVQDGRRARWRWHAGRLRRVR
jgi:hypothetical protein